MDTLQLHFTFQSPEEIPEFLPFASLGKNTGDDGRAFYFNDADKVIGNFETTNKVRPVDINHSTQLLGQQGLESPSYGKIYAIEMRGEQLGALVRWSKKGKKKLKNEEYFYYSPAVAVDRNDNLINLASIGLTNDPNLDTLLLNSTDREEGIMPDTVNKTGDDKQAIDLVALLSDALQLNSKQSNNGDADVLAAVKGLQDKLTESEKVAVDMHSKQDALVATIDELKLQMFAKERDSILSKVPAGRREALSKLCLAPEQLDALRDVVNAEPEIPGKLEVHTKQEMVDAQAKYQEDVIASAKAKRGVK